MNAAVFRSVPTLVGSYLLVPTFEGELGAIDVETGELVWRLPGDGSSIRSLAPAGEVLVAVRGGAESGFEAYRARSRRRARSGGLPDHARARIACWARWPCPPSACWLWCSCWVASWRAVWDRHSVTIHRQRRAVPTQNPSTLGKTRTRRRDEQEQAFDGHWVARTARHPARVRHRHLKPPPGEACSTRSSRPRAAGATSMPTIRTSLARGVVTVAGTPVLAVAAVAIVAAEWLGALALGYEGPFALFVSALALPPVGTSFDATLSTALFGLQGGFFAILGFVALRAVVQALLVAAIVEVLRASPLGRWTLVRALRHASRHAGGQRRRRRSAHPRQPARPAARPRVRAVDPDGGARRRRLPA